VTAAAVPLAARSERITITRITDGDKTTALLIEGPEPLTFSQHDVSATLSAKASPTIVKGDERVRDVLAQLRVDPGPDSVSLPRKVPFSGDRAVRVNHDEVTTSFTIYNPPEPVAGQSRNVGLVRERVSVPPPGSKLEELRKFKDGTLAILLADGEIGAVLPVPDTPPPPIPFAILTNGAENVAVLIPTTAPLDRGSYELIFSIRRQRWRVASPTGDSTYAQNRSAALVW
jgi:hypothetical protein